MLKKFNNIVDNDPIIFAEDVYLCTEMGVVLTGRCGIKRKIKNVFECMKEEDVRFIKSNMSLPGFRPLILADTRDGTAIFDLSLCPKYGLLIVIFPHFGRDELLGLASDRLSERILLSDDMKLEAERQIGCVPGDAALIFAGRLLSVRRSGEYFAFLLKTNSQIFEAMLDIAESFGKFYGCELNVVFDSVSDSFEPKNSFCFESFAFALISLAFVARSYSINRGARLKIYVNEMGYYFDFAFKIAEQYEGESISLISTELKHLMSKAENRMFNCICAQKDGVFVLRAFPWFRTPDSAELKERPEDFTYDC